VFDTNIFRQVKTGNFISKAHVYLNSRYINFRNLVMSRDFTCGKKPNN